VKAEREDQVIFAYDGIIFILVGVVWPITVALGLLRIARMGWPNQVLPKFSYAALCFASLAFAAFLFFDVFLYFSSTFDESSPTAMAIFLWLFRLSLCAFVAAVVGAFRSGPLRWLAPIASFSSILPWFIQLSLKL
jgi:hypothetical protein